MSWGLGLVSDLSMVGQLGLPALAFLDRKELSRLRILFLLSPVALAVIVLVIFGSLGG